MGIFIGSAAKARSPDSVGVCLYESVWLAKKALVSPQVGLVHSGQRRVNWREQGLLDFKWDWTKSARA